MSILSKFFHNKYILTSLNLQKVSKMIPILLHYRMKTTLDSLLKNEFKPDEVIMYKSDGPLRKLKILSDYWMAKVIGAREKCSPSLAVDSSVDLMSDAIPRSRLSSPKTKTRKLPALRLNHTYTDPDLAASLKIPVQKRPQKFRYSEGYSQRSR